MLINQHGIDYEESLLKAPLRHEAQALCEQMPLNTLFFERSSMLSHQLKAGLERTQQEEGSLLHIETVEVHRPDAMDDSIHDYVFSEVLPTTCESPHKLSSYKLFSSLESEGDTRARLCAVQETPVDSKEADVLIVEDLPEQVEVINDTDESLVIDTRQSSIIESTVVTTPEYSAPSFIQPEPNKERVKNVDELESIKYPERWRNQNGHLYLTW